MGKIRPTSLKHFIKIITNFIKFVFQIDKANELQNFSEQH